MKMSASSVIAAAGFSLQQFTRAFIHNPGSCGTAIRSGARQALRSLTAASSSVGGYPRGGGGWVGGIQGGGGGANLYRRHQVRAMEDCDVVIDAIGRGIWFLCSRYIYVCGWVGAYSGFPVEW